MTEVKLNAGDWLTRQEEVERYLSTKRQDLRALAVARCGQDSRILGAVYQLKDGIWLWHRSPRLTPEESRREHLGSLADEYDTLIENGTTRAEAWEMTLGTVGEPSFCPSARDEPSPKVSYLGDHRRAVAFYRRASLAEISRLNRDLRGTFSSCPKCRLTYLIEYVAMHYAAGKCIVDGRNLQVTVLPGRVIPDGKDPHLAGAPAYGLINSWQATPWRLAKTER